MKKNLSRCYSLNWGEEKSKKLEEDEIVEPKQEEKPEPKAVPLPEYVWQTMVSILVFVMAATLRGTVHVL